jgi:carbon-monoxide dehydrogenase medium subunit
MAGICKSEALKSLAMAYARPATLEEAVRLVASQPRASRILAGGTDLLQKFFSAETPEAALVSLRGIEELRRVEMGQEGQVFVGSMATHAEVALSPLVKESFPAIAKASRCVGSPAIRNRATIGGNICNASPSADTAPPLLGYNAKIVITGATGERVVPIEDFFTGPSTTALNPGEILKGFILMPPRGWVADYEKLGARKAMEIALVNVCVAIQKDGNGFCSDLRIALGAVAPTPMRAEKAERRLKGEKITAKLIGEAAEAAAEEARPISDLRAAAGYRKEMVRFLVKKLLSELAGVH